MMKKAITVIVGIAMLLTMTVPAFADGYDAVVALAKPTKVQELKVLKNGYRSLKVTWKAVEGADKYQVYRSTTGKSGSFALRKTTTGTIYTNTGVTCGKTYYYKVRAVNSKGKSSFSVVKGSKVQPARVKITKIRPPEDKVNRVHWNKVNGATGYQVYRKRTDKRTWKLFKTVSSKYSYVTDYLRGKMEYDKQGYKIGYNYDDLNYDWQYKVRAYRMVNGKRVYGYFSTPAKWTPDWTIEQIYEESWKYVEAMKFPMYEEVPSFPEPDENGNYIRPKKDGSTYSWKHVIGFNTVLKDFVYTNPANGNTKYTTTALKKYTPDNSNWGVLWPVLINPYMTHASIMKKIKGKLDVEITDISNANPLYWDSQGGFDDNGNWNENGGWTDFQTFTIYYEKYGNGYKLWQLW